MLQRIIVRLTLEHREKGVKFEKYEEMYLEMIKIAENYGFKCEEISTAKKEN